MTACIFTKYLGQTNTRSSRIKASARSLSGAKDPYVVVPYVHGMSEEENHDSAALELAEQLGWLGSWVAGDHDSGRVFIRIPYVGNYHASFTVTGSKPQGRTVARRV